MIAAIADHLWQSTLFAAAAALLTLPLRNNLAYVRYSLWFAASFKFLVPFAALIALGEQFGGSSAPVAQPVMFFVETIGEPFSHPQLSEVVAGASSATASSGDAILPILLVAIWFTGAALMLLTWWVRWRIVAAVVREGSKVEDGRELNALRRLERLSGIQKPLPMVSSTSSLEPGVFGILNPVLLWPRRISQRLADAQVDAILAHELAHVRRRDNLAAAAHMVVQSLFWFYPLVWWIGARMVDERERACDEDVIRMGNEPHVYAESILKTCEFCVEAPSVCVAGVTGSNLKKRLREIMRGSTGVALHGWKKLLLGTAGLASLAGPVAVGMLNAPPVRAEIRGLVPRSQSTQDGPAPRRSGAESGQNFEVASIKRNRSGEDQVRLQMQPGGRFTATNVALRTLIRSAYQLQDFQIVGGPDWVASDRFASERFDVVAKAEGEVPPSPPGTVGPMQLMLRSLLEERFKLAVHQETRELPIYALVLARTDQRLGPKLQASTVDCQAVVAAALARGGPPQPPPQVNGRPVCGMRISSGQMIGGGFPLSQLASALSGMVQRIVVDRTGLTGNFDLEVRFTPDQPQGNPPGSAATPLAADPNSPSIFTALQEQLGLKLESERAPVEVLVIDRAERPTEN